METISGMKFGDLGAVESWGAGAPEIQVLIKREDGQEFQPELEPRKRWMIDDRWWYCNYSLFPWSVNSFRYYAFVMLEVDRFVTSSTNYSITISGNIKGISVSTTLDGTFNWTNEKKLVNGYNQFDDPSLIYYGSSETFDTYMGCPQ